MVKGGLDVVDSADGDADISGKEDDDDDEDESSL